MMRLRVLAAAAVLSFAELPVAAQTAPPAAAPEAAVAAPASAAEASAPAAQQPAATDAPAAAATAAAAPPPPPLPPSLTVRIDLSGQKMTVSENGVAKFTWPISSGLARYATPTGNFRPIRTEKMWYSRKYDLAPMPNAVFFHQGFAIHGTQAVGSLGRPASHGCVRLAPGNAAAFYKMVQKHGLGRTRIALSGSPKYSQPLVASKKVAPQPTQSAGFTPGFFTYASFDYVAPPKAAKANRSRKYAARGYAPNGYPVRQR